MEQAGFCFDTVTGIDFIHKKFATTGFSTSEKNAIREEVWARNGDFFEGLVPDADYLIVKESYPVLTKKYLRALELRKRGSSLTVISYACFRQYTAEPLGEKLDPVPSGGGRLHFNDTVWLFCGHWDEREESMIKERGGRIVTRYSKYTQYLICNTKNMSLTTLEAARQREREGSAVVLTKPLFDMWAPEHVTEETAAAFAWDDRLFLIKDYLSRPAVWNSSINGADGAMFSLLKHQYFDVLDSPIPDDETMRLCLNWACRYGERDMLIRARRFLADLMIKYACYEELAVLLDMMREEEKSWVGSARSDGLYTCLFAKEYIDKILENGNTEEKARFLTLTESFFADAGRRAPLPELDLGAAEKAYPYWIPGAVQRFGTFPQAGENAEPEPIEWIVLDVQEDKALLLSRYAIDTAPFGDAGSGTWEQCALRRWLHGKFLRQAFSNGERRAVLTVQIATEKSPGAAPELTLDSVFLLSVRETERYFGPDEDLRCGQTPYTMARGGKQNQYSKKDGKYTILWWLRSPGRYKDYAVLANHFGPLLKEGYFAGSRGYGVRPALWVALEREGDRLRIAAPKQ